MNTQMTMSNIEVWDGADHATADLTDGAVTALFVKSHDDELWEVWGLKLNGVVYREPHGRDLDQPERLPEGDLNSRLTQALQDHRMTRQKDQPVSGSNTRSDGGQDA